MGGIVGFSDTLIDWYHSNKRELPWRQTTDPYTIWISEIVLQQTRVEQGKDYFLRFVKRFPNFEELAKADIDEVMKYWQGLGYYSRARNLHFAANQIVNEFNGQFPNTYKDILTLKGVGDYTSSAIASFSFGLPHPVIDGNVIRVVCRLAGISESIKLSETQKRIREELEQLFDKENPADFNQAIMEFGALYCTPSSPDCQNCPFNDSCVAFNTGRVKEIPFRDAKIKKRKRYLHYFVLRNESNVLLKKRMEKDIWQNLYDFPLVETKDKSSEISLTDLLKSSFDQLKLRSEKPDKKWKHHVLSHQDIHYKFHEYEVENLDSIVSSEWLSVSSEELPKYPVPKIVDSYLNES